jgi:hypothetical protein
MDCTDGMGFSGGDECPSCQLHSSSGYVGYVMLPLDCIWLSGGCRNGVMCGFMVGTSLKIVLLVKLWTA